MHGTCNVHGYKMEAQFHLNAKMFHSQICDNMCLHDLLEVAVSIKLALLTILLAAILMETQHKINLLQ